METKWTPHKGVDVIEENFRVDTLVNDMDTPVLTPERIRIAVSSGVFTGGWREYPCLEEVDGAASGYLNYFSDT